jgi:GntR family transcriptional regulator/MocR family aminotransferase
LDYAPPQGSAALQKAITDYLRRARGVVCDADRVVIVTGAQQALDLLARVLLEPGDRVVIEDPHYLKARQCFQSCGARLIPIPVDDQGLNVEALSRRGDGARLVYVTPSHQFPTGVILSLGRRLSLLRWAQEAGCFIVEDDYDSEFRYQGWSVEAIQGLDQSGRVVYVGSFSKLLFPAIRIGYLVLPPARLQPVVAAKLLVDRHSSTLLQEVLAEFIQTGGFERHLSRCRKRYAARRRVLLEALSEHLGDRVEVSGTNSGLHALVWLRNVPASQANPFLRLAARAGVGVYSVLPFYLQPPARLGLILRYASMTEKDIRGGIKRLAAVIP